MKADLEKARHILEAENCTCVFCKGESIYRSSHRGVKPLLDLLDAETDVQGFSAADKVVGRATAFLYCLLGVKEVHALVISKLAVQVLHRYGIATSWDHQVDAIQNRQKNGPCPMEAATREIEEVQEALTAIRDTLHRLQQN